MHIGVNFNFNSGKFALYWFRLETICLRMSLRKYVIFYSFSGNKLNILHQFLVTKRIGLSSIETHFIFF